MAAGTWTFPNAARSKLSTAPSTSTATRGRWRSSCPRRTSARGTTTYAGVTNEHANGNGYTTGGASISLTLSGTTTVTVDITTDPVWTASAGSITARFAAIYEVGGNVLCYCLLDSAPADVTATSGNTLTVAANASRRVHARLSKALRHERHEDQRAPGRQHAGRDGRVRRQPEWREQEGHPGADSHVPAHGAVHRVGRLGRSVAPGRRRRRSLAPTPRTTSWSSASSSRTKRT